MEQYFDAGALITVVVGTCIATLARCGWQDIAQAFRQLAALAQKGFDEASTRASLTRVIHEFQTKGILCAEIALPSDRAIADLIDHFVRHEAHGELIALHRSSRSSREIARHRAVRTFEYAGELAPVFGLVGTLFAITQLGPAFGESPTQAVMSSIASAVLSTLYGVLFAHLFCIPLARAIERRGETEEAARQELLLWLVSRLPERHSTSRVSRMDSAA